MHFAPVARFEMGTMVLVRREGEERGNFTLVFGTACKKVLFLSIQLITMQGWEATTPFFSLGLLSRLTSPPPRPSSAFPRVSRPSWLKILPFSFLFPLARLFFSSTASWSPGMILRLDGVALFSSGTERETSILIILAS